MKQLIEIMKTEPFIGILIIIFVFGMLTLVGSVFRLMGWI